MSGMNQATRSEFLSPVLHHRQRPNRRQNRRPEDGSNLIRLCNMQFYGATA
jgi:hypothetical protein